MSEAWRHVLWPVTSLLECGTGALCVNRRRSKGQKLGSGTKCPHCGYEEGFPAPEAGDLDLELVGEDGPRDGTDPGNKNKNLLLPNALMKKASVALSEKAEQLDGMRVSVCLDGFGAVERNEEEPDDAPSFVEETPSVPTLSVMRRVTRQSILNRVSAAKKSIHSEGRRKAPELPQNPDFGGEWVMVRYEGDMNAFMKDMGVRWPGRKAAAAVGYGVNKTFHTIKGSDERLHITTKNPKGTFVKDIRLDGSEQDDRDPVRNRPIKIIPYWETLGRRVNLTIESYMPEGKGDPIQLPITRRYMEGISMVVEQISARGVMVRRIFAPH